MARQYREAIRIAGRAKLWSDQWRHDFFIEAPAQASKVPAGVAQFGKLRLVRMLNDFPPHGRIEIIEIEPDFSGGFAVNRVVRAEGLCPPAQPEVVRIA